MLVILPTTDGYCAIDPQRVRRIQSFRGDTLLFYDEDDGPLEEIRVGLSVQEATHALKLLDPGSTLQP